MPAWARVVTGIAALRVAIAVALYLSGQVDTATAAPLPVAAYAGISLAFGAVGAALVVANKNDVRAAWLGGVLLLLAAPLTGRLLAASYEPGWLWIDRVRPDAFLPAFLWRFTIEFPSPLKPSMRRAAAEVAAATAVVGALAFAINLSLALWPTIAGDWRAILMTGRAAGSLYWLAVFIPSGAAFAALLARMVRSTGTDLFRLRVFIGGLAAGLLPLFVEVTIEELWPTYKTLVHQPAVEPWVGLVLFVPLAAVPLLVSYSVVFDRVVDTRVVVRAAVQYLLARFMIVALTSVPFIALGLYLLRHSTEPLVALLIGPRPLALIAAVLAGTGTLRARRRWMSLLDRRFFREAYDPEALLAGVMTDDLVGQSSASVAERLAREIDRTFHARADLFVPDEVGRVLCDPRGDRPPLNIAATLVALATADARPMDVHPDPHSVLERLSESEKAWIATGGYRLIVPLRTPGGEPAGLLAIGAKRSELPYSEAERRSLAGLAAPIALAIENNRLRNTPEPRTEPAARECQMCSRLLAPDAASCECGGMLAEAPVPFTLRGVYRFDRRIGAGGMGVVYRGVDVPLGRTVAIKTLPSAARDHIARLRREAQVMASMIHANLAVIYGIETWRGVPFLIEEYLDGGTLTDRLRAGPMEIDEVLNLGITLARVLEQLHAAGIIHCDIKPSNIGYSRTGVVKVLDFGLAHLLRRSGQELTTTLTSSPGPLSSVATSRGVMGTFPYMSPEALRGAPPVAGFDVWSLSVVLYEAIAGRRPFAGSGLLDIAEAIAAGVPDIRDVRSECREAIATFFSRALAIDPALRFQDATALRTSLSRLRA